MRARRSHQGQLFLAYVQQLLTPTLAPGDIVITDNLGSHKGHAMRQAVRSCGVRLLFLPPYVPDLDPIERVFAKLKTLRRKANEGSVETTWKRISSLLEALLPRRVRKLPEELRVFFSLG